MAAKSWQSAVTPRDDLVSGRPLDAAEFAVHLDQVRDRRAPEDYQNPVAFFERTYLTDNLKKLAVDVLRRLSGDLQGASAVYNLVTQFGGGKTHSLTLLYHLATHGPDAVAWRGVQELMSKAHLDTVPKARTAVFVGTEFDSIAGRGGDDGTPLRKTPWGEVAFQLGGESAYRIVAAHDRECTTPNGDVIQKLLPDDTPCLILMDELMSYVSHARKSGLGGQMYHFLQNLSEAAAGSRNVVLAVSVPASELEMSAEDQSDYQRFKKLLDRVGKPMVMAAESETSEIIRRRLFDWQGIPADGKRTARAYASWIVEHRQFLPQWFPVDNAQAAFEAAYPFHPSVLSVFERKWAALPRFQRTRGVLRMLALWISRVYADPATRLDPLIDLGSAPLEDADFRTVVMEQLGASDAMQGVVTTDICGSPGAHAVRLDAEGVPAIKQARLHRKAAAAIFFESNGGHEKERATEPEVRLAMSSPDLDIANVETVLDALTPPDGACYFLHASHHHYWFHTKPTLTKVLADRVASIKDEDIERCVQDQVQETFGAEKVVQKRFFPKKSSDIPDSPVFTLVVLDPEQSMTEPERTRRLVDQMTKEYGTSARTFKSALVWCVPEDATVMAQEARKLLAWEEIAGQGGDLQLDEDQQRQAQESIKRGKRDLRESTWRTYKNIMLLGRDNEMRLIDLGLINSSSGGLVEQLLARLRQEDLLQTKAVSPNFLVRQWPPALEEWSTRALANAFFSSPQLPRLLDAELLKDTIASGVEGGIIAYVGKDTSGAYNPFEFEKVLLRDEIDISEDFFIITAERARQFIEPSQLTELVLSPNATQLKIGQKQTFIVKGKDQHGSTMQLDTVTWEATGGEITDKGVFTAGAEEGTFAVTASCGEITSSATVTIVSSKAAPPPPSAGGRLSWSGDVPARKWMNFYTKVLTRFANSEKLSLTVSFSVDDAASSQAADETRAALRDLGLDDDVSTD